MLRDEGEAKANPFLRQFGLEALERGHREKEGNWYQRTWQELASSRMRRGSVVGMYPIDAKTQERAQGSISIVVLSLLCNAKERVDRANESM